MINRGTTLPLCLFLILLLPVTNNAWSFSKKIIVEQNAAGFDRRRRRLGVIFFSSVLGVTIGGGGLQPACARNLPEPTGADVSKVGTVEALVPIVSLRASLSRLLSRLSAPNTKEFSLDESIPKDEMSFKKLFDAYSDQVSYKQRFLDQNAFLVYYSKGFDGPGRDSIEADINERQTQQFGFRNEAWIAWQSFLAETAFLLDEDNDCIAYLAATIHAIDSYLKLAPADDVKAARARIVTP